jgi:hypothetical protein
VEGGSNDIMVIEMDEMGMMQGLFMHYSCYTKGRWKAGYFEYSRSFRRSTVGRKSD